MGVPVMWTIFAVALAKKTALYVVGRVSTPHTHHTHIFISCLLLSLRAELWVSEGLQEDGRVQQENNHRQNLAQNNTGEGQILL